MTTFAFSELVNAPLADVVDAALGANSSGKFNAKDIGKCVKMGASQNYVLATGGDEIEGFVATIADFTVNSGFSFGSVQRNKRFIAEVGANQGATAMAVLDLVVADTQVALGTAGAPKVKTGSPTTYKWRVIRRYGDGTAGTKVLLERI